MSVEAVCWICAPEIEIGSYVTCCSVLKCVAVCCRVMQCVAVCCSALQCVAVRCRVLQSHAVCCSVLQCVAVCYSVLQCVAVCCSVLQCVVDVTIESYYVCTRDGLPRYMLQCVAVCCRCDNSVILCMHLRWPPTLHVAVCGAWA